MNRLFVVALLLWLGALCAQVMPQWGWVAHGGGYGDDLGWDVATDSQGNSYIAGHSRNSQYYGAFSLPGLGNRDIFVAKVSPQGNWLWVRAAGSGDWEYGFKIAVDGMGNVYLTGYYYGWAHFGNIILSNAGYTDMFIAKLDTNGNWQWAITVGGMGWEEGRGLAVDAAGNIYVCGWYSDDCAFGDHIVYCEGGTDVFVGKLDTNGTWLWMDRAGGADFDYGYDIAVDAEQHVYVSGHFQGTAQFGVTTLQSTGSSDVFAAELDQNGNWLWARVAGGTGADECFGIMADVSGNVFICGNFSGTAQFGPQPLESMGGNDIFVAKLDAEGSWLWAISGGSAQNDRAWDIEPAPKGCVCLAGSFQQAGFFGTITLAGSGENDIVAAKVSGEGTWLWALAAGGTGSDSGLGISVRPNGEIYVSGCYNNGCHFGNINYGSYGAEDIFVARVNLTEPDENYVLSSFTASITDQNDVLLSWTTAFETNMQGFNLYRGTTNSLVSSAQVNGSLIPATNTSSPQNYAYTDNSVVAGQTYYYWLQGVELEGGSSYNGPVIILTPGESNMEVVFSSLGVDLVQPWFVRLSWTTLYESNLIGYLIYRSTSTNPGSAVMLGFPVIPATNSNNPHDYSVTDTNVSPGNFYYYWLVAMNAQNDLWFGPLGILVHMLSDDDPTADAANLLQAAWPNPFTLDTNIEVSIKLGESGVLAVYNVLGQKVRSYPIGAGKQVISWDGRDERGCHCASGIYFFRLSTPTCHAVRKVVLAK